MKKYALITGGSKGLGRSIALKFAQNKVNIGIVGRNADTLENTAKDVRVYGVDCHVFVADLSRVDEVKKLAKEALSKVNTWDMLVNNAGFAKQKPLLEMELTDWEYIQDLNLRSVFLLSQQIVPQMIEQKYGKVINISSLGAFYGTYGLGAYGVSKAALNQLTRTMAVEWGPHNIQCNAICPTIVMTDMGKSIWGKPENLKMKNAFLEKIPSGRFGSPEDVADLAWFLASDQSGFINGQAIPLEGGKMAQP
ncbi:MAG: SDR family oxidoreductase [Chlorobi bacterium]|nr:SDR family oxidoreductase [Chlorobiota bacterium]